MMEFSLNLLGHHQNKANKATRMWLDQVHCHTTSNKDFHARFNICEYGLGQTNWKVFKKLVLDPAKSSETLSRRS